MPTKYNEEMTDAIEMIEEFGGPFEIQRLLTGVPDPDKPWRTSKIIGRDDRYTVTAVMLEFKTSQQSAGFTAGSEDTRFVLPGDMIVYLAAASPRVVFIPAARDIVVPPNSQGRFGVVDTITLAPDGYPILYKLWIRK